MVVHDWNVSEPNDYPSLLIKLKHFLLAHVFLDDRHHLLFCSIIQTNVIKILRFRNFEVCVDIQEVFDYNLSFLNHLSIKTTELGKHFEERAWIEVF